MEFSFRGDICADISKRLADQARQKDGFYENIDESHRALCGRIFECGARRFRIPDRLRYAELGLEEGDYLVHEYWSDTFYGVVSGSVTVSVPACGCAVLAVR